MKKTFRIAKNELRTLFYSPIAWFLLIVFIFDYGQIYTNGLNRFKTTQDLGGPLLKYIKNITQNILGVNSGLLAQALQRIFLYIPLITMGLMSRETSSGTIKLLYSSPVKIRQIVFGKYLAMVLFSLVMVAILGIFVVCGVFNIENIDAGPLFGGLLGIFLMLSVYSAIGLFMSCLTTYQVVAAVSTLVMLAFLSYIGTVWQDIDFVRDLTFFLSISGRASHMMIGLLTTKDILYFLLITGMFLALTFYKLKGERETRSGWLKAARFGGVVLSTVLVGYIVSRPALVGYLDVTATKSQTLTKEGQKIIEEMKGKPLEITSYINLLDPLYSSGMPQERNLDLQRWEPYLRFKPDINLKYVYYYDSSASKFLFVEGKTMKEIAEKYAKTYKTSLDRFETPEQIRKQIDLRPEMNRYVIQLKYGDKTSFLRLFDDLGKFPSEPEILASMKRLITEAPKIAFVSGELERNITQIGDRQYRLLTNEKAFRSSLINQGFDVETISLQEQDIPNDIAALVIADPIVKLDTAITRKLERYIAAGGNLLIAGEPGRQNILNPLLKPLGVQLMDGVLVQQSNDYSPDLIQGRLASAAKGLSKKLTRDAEDSVAVSLIGAVGLSYDPGGPFKVQPLMVTDGKSTWSKKKKFNPEMIDKIEAPFANQTVAAATITAVPVPVGTAGDGGRINIMKPSDLNFGKPLSKEAINAAKATLAANDGKKAASVSKQNESEISKSSAPVTAEVATMKATPQRPATLAGKPVLVKGIVHLANGDSSVSVAVPMSTATLQVVPEKPHLSSSGAGLSSETATGQATARARVRATATTTATSTAPADLTAEAGKAGTDSVQRPAFRVLTSNLKLIKNKKLLVRVKPGALQKQEQANQNVDDKPADLSFSAADGDIRGTLPVALGLSREVNGKQQRIVVVGDADFISNAELNRKNLRTCNFEFATSVFRWFSNGKFPVDIDRPDPKDDRVTVSDGGITAMKVVFLGVLPCITLLLGTVLLIRRRRK